MSKVTDAIHLELDSIEFRLQNGDNNACGPLGFILGNIMMRVKSFLYKKGQRALNPVYYEYDQLWQRAKTIFDKYCAGP